MNKANEAYKGYWIFGIYYTMYDTYVNKITAKYKYIKITKTKVTYRKE